MRLLFAVYFIVNVLALLIVLVRARQQSCTANHCGEISKDIKTLHTEVKNLVALVKALCVRSLQVPFRIISMGSSFNFVIFPMFSMRSDFKIALLSSSQSIPSLLARSSATQESKYKVNCFSCNIPNRTVAWCVYSQRTPRLFTRWLIPIYMTFFSIRSRRSQVYPLMFGSQKIPVYCHMENFGCGSGGWTLTMKINGAKVKSLPPKNPLILLKSKKKRGKKLKTEFLVFQRTFHYDSHFWNNRNVYHLTGGKTGFDSHETKLPTYWNTPFTKICLDMKTGHQLRFILINQRANSLFSLGNTAPPHWVVTRGSGWLVTGLPAVVLQ